MDTPRPGIQPQVKAVDQTLIDGNKVKIDLVTSSGPGWLVIYTLNDAGQPVQPIGQAPIKDGENRDVTVQVDPSRATGTLYAQLHVDHGQVGTYEFPGPDAPLMLGVAMIASQFDVQAAEGAGPTSLVPAVTVADQPIKNSSVVIPEVISDGDGWIVVHRQNGDLTIGSGVGNAPVHSGVNTNVVVEVDTTRTSGTMYAMLHKDLGQKGVIEFPGADEPVLLNGQIVAPTFKVTLTSDSDVIINVGQDVNSTQYLVDGRNMTLYFSINDPRGKSNCTGECLETWRPLFATGQIITGPGVDKNKVNVIIRENGTRQVTYAGAPLYYYTKDIDPGDIRGQGFDGAWFTLTP